MNVKLHYSGLAISYNSKGGGKKNLSPSTLLPDSFSRINRQKRQVHDMVEWIRRNCKYKPLIGVLTVPIQSDNKLTNENLSKFWENMRSNYDLKNYVWVREYQGQGRPHYHFVADSKYMDGVAVSRYWSGLFDCDNTNSLRLGTDPKHPPRKFFVDSPRMSRYLTKYLGAGTMKLEDGKKVRVMRVNSEEKNSKIKTFGNSQEVGKKSRPVTYDVVYKREFGTAKNMFGQEVEVLDKLERDFVLCENSKNELMEVYGSIPDEYKTFDDSKFSWINPNPLHKVYYGIPKKSQ